MKVLIAISITIVLLALGACAPSPEMAATMTAQAWSPTPPPTPTATPIPYDLTIHVRDASGAPVPNAGVVIPESGSNDSRQADSSGTLAWKNLPTGTVNLNVYAPSYYTAVQPVSMDRGQTELVVILLNDPYALAPDNACASGEKLLYSEDFEDAKAQGWPNITAAVDSKAENGWSIVPQPDGNQVARFTGTFENTDTLQGLTFDNAVWRLKVETEGQDGFSLLDFRQAAAAGVDTRYPVQWGAGGMLTLSRLETPGTGEVAVKTTGLQMKQDRWYYLEISYFQGNVQIWVDGKRQASYSDPAPLPRGTIGLEGHILKDAKTAYYFDDLSVCELNAPFTKTLYKPPTP